MENNPDPLIQCFVARAVPYPHNRKYHGHEASSLIVFIREEERDSGVEAFKRVLARERWQMLALDSHSKLNELEAMAEGPPVSDGYLHALKHGDWIHVLPDNFGAGKKKPFGKMQGIRLSEIDIDRIVVRGGGQRYEPPGPESSLARNADYLFLDHVVELKEIRENALDKPDRQVRLAALFEELLRGELTVPLDPDLLNPADRGRFFEIISEPIRRQIKSAVGQVRSTKESLGRRDMRGGIILINSGTHALDHGTFHRLAQREVAKYPDDIHELTSISTWFLTNGFDYNLNFAIEPAEPTTEFQQAFGVAYNAEVSHLMGEWARGGFMPPSDAMPPHQSLGFDYQGRSYYWEPSRLPNTMGLPDPLL